MPRLHEHKFSTVTLGYASLSPANPVPVLCKVPSAWATHDAFCALPAAQAGKIPSTKVQLPRKALSGSAKASGSGAVIGEGLEKVFMP